MSLCHDTHVDRWRSSGRTSTVPRSIRFTRRRDPIEIQCVLSAICQVFGEILMPYMPIRRVRIEIFYNKHSRHADIVEKTLRIPCSLGECDNIEARGSSLFPVPSHIRLGGAIYATAHTGSQRKPVRVECRKRSAVSVFFARRIGAEIFRS